MKMYIVRMVCPADVNLPSYLVGPGFKATPTTKSANPLKDLAFDYVACQNFFEKSVPEGKERAYAKIGGIPIAIQVLEDGVRF